MPAKPEPPQLEPDVLPAVEEVEQVVPGYAEDADQGVLEKILFPRTSTTIRIRLSVLKTALRMEMN